MRWYMKYKNYENTGWFSVVISLLIIWFLLVLTTGIYNLILKELYDNRDMWNAIKAYAWAESAQEIALLQIKEKGYWYDVQVENSHILGDDPNNFKAQKEVAISYDLGTKTNNYEGEIEEFQYDIIPLFYIDESGWEENINNMNFSVSQWAGNLVWNLVSSDSWISWVWDETEWDKRILLPGGEGELWYERETITSFLSSNSIVYFILFNSWNWDVKYTLNSSNYFSKPKTRIISSATVGNVKQNLWTTLDNTEYLNILKYSIYSN